MSSRKSKLDLLVRVRYANPLPAPPFPPKLLNIPTHPARYAGIDFTNQLANETPLPMIVDADCGMPLDLGQWESLWEENGDDSKLNPDPANLPPVDPRDTFLFSDATMPSAQYANGGSTQHGTPAPTPNTVHVPWLRKTEYLSRETMSRGGGPAELKPVDDALIDVSREAQIRDIEASFPSEPLDLATLKHPMKPHLTAVESYEILPDAELWANEYDLFKFSERPGERGLDVDDFRLDCAVLRPMESDGDHFLAYYLTKDDDAALKFKAARHGQLENGSMDEKRLPSTFHFVRDYETVKIEQDVPNEFLLVLDDGDLPPAKVSRGMPAQRRAKGAFYKNIERKITLKKKRVNKFEVAYTDKWDVIQLTHSHMVKDEVDEREEALAEIIDPTYQARTADADGEVDESFAAAALANLKSGAGMTFSG